MLRRLDMLRILRLSAAFASLALALIALTYGRASKPGVRFAVGSRPGNLVYLPLDLARAQDYFAEEGIEAEFVPFDGGTEAARALAAGRADFSGNSIDHAIELRAARHQLKMVASFTNLPTLTMVVPGDLKQQIRTNQDLKGRRLGVPAIVARN